MKVELISPAKESVKKAGKGWLPPYALMILAGLTPREIDIKITDEVVADVDLDGDADLHGITIGWSARAPRAYWIADELRKRGKTVVMGGAHVTAMPDEALEHADAIVIGEAEGVWQDLLNDFNNRNLKRVYKNMHPASLGGIMPRRDLIDPRKYQTLNVVQTTRGCPHDCDYCSVPVVYGRGYRHRPLKDVLAEIDRLKGSWVIFLDDNITGDPRYAEELFRELIPRKKKWIGQSDLLITKRPELLKLAQESGCKGLFIGFETILQRGLEGVNKQWSKAEEYGSAIRTLHEHGIGVVGAFMFGLDEHTPEIFNQTVEFVKRTNIEVVQYSILTPLPGTRFFDRLVEEGRIDHSTLDCSLLDGNHATYEPKNMTKEELQQGFFRAYEDTYSFRSSLLRSWRSPKVYLPVNLGFWKHYWGISRGYRAVGSFVQSEAFESFVDDIRGKAEAIHCLPQKGRYLYYEAREGLGNVVARLKIPLGKLKRKREYMGGELGRELAKITGLPVFYKS